MQTGPWFPQVRGCLAILLLALQPVQAERIVRLTAAEQLEHLTNPAHAVLRKAYGRLHIKLEVTYLPLSRGLLEVNAGNADGDVARIAGVADEFPALLRVPTAVGAIELCAYLRDGAGSGIQTLNDLTASTLKIGVRQGSRIASQALREVALSAVRTYESLFEMLSMERIDAAIAPCGTLNRLLPKFDEAMRTKLRTVRAGITLESQPLYHYLNKRNADLLVPLDRELVQMRKDGTINHVWSQ